MTPRNLAPDLTAHGLQTCTACSSSIDGVWTTVGCERCRLSGRAHLFRLTETDHKILIDYGSRGTPAPHGRMTIADPDVRAEFLRLIGQAAIEIRRAER